MGNDNYTAIILKQKECALEQLSPAKIVIPQLEIKQNIRLAFIGDVDYYLKDIIKIAKPIKEPYFFSLLLSMPLPDGAVDFVLAWLIKSIKFDLLVSELIRISSPTGIIWTVVWDATKWLPGLPQENSIIRSMAKRGWIKTKEISLSKDYHALEFKKNNKFSD